MLDVNGTPKVAENWEISELAVGGVRWLGNLDQGQKRSAQWGPKLLVVGGQSDGEPWLEG
jgi:hypothetical protein